MTVNVQSLDCVLVQRVQRCDHSFRKYWQAQNLFDQRLVGVDDE